MQLGLRPFSRPPCLPDAGLYTDELPLSDVIQSISNTNHHGCHELSLRDLSSDSIFFITISVPSFIARCPVTLTVNLTAHQRKWGGSTIPPFTASTSGVLTYITAGYPARKPSQRPPLPIVLRSHVDNPRMRCWDVCLLFYIKNLGGHVTQKHKIYSKKLFVF